MTNTVSRILSDDTLNKIIQIESAGNPNAKAPTSSASGLGQFINSTWVATLRKHRPDLLKGGTVPASRGAATAALQIEMLARFTEDNAAGLGRGYTPGDLYLAHFLGLGDARRLFRAPPSDLASNHVSARAVAANRSILAGKTCAQVRGWAQASMDSRWTKAGKPDWVRRFAGPPKPPTPNGKGGLAAAIAAAFAAVAAFIQSHPVETCIGIVAVIAVAIWFWRRRHRGS